MIFEFEKFKAEKESALAECLRGRLSEEEDSPDMPSIDSAKSLKEQFYWFKFGVNHPPEGDDINWDGLEKELRAYADEVAQEWHERKKAERKHNAMM